MRRRADKAQAQHFDFRFPAHVLQAFQRVRQRCIEQFRVIVVIYKRAAAALARNQIFRGKVIQGGNPPASSMKRNTRYALALLFMVSFFNYMDRYMLAVLLPAIKADLQLSDTEIGFITGLAFTLFYATMGIPIARLADRYSRKNIIAIALSVWSVMTALCGLAQNFVQLAVARIMVGVGEAGARPPSHSLIADMFPVEKRARAISVYTLGAPVGILVGFLLGGWITQLYGWRAALFTVGIPGILLALLVYRRLDEPERGAADGLSRTMEVQPPSFRRMPESSEAADGLPRTMEVPPFWFSLKTLMASPTFRHLSFATGLYTVLWLGVVQWLPSFFTRSFGLEIGEVSTWLAIILSSSQLIGMLTGGYLADRLGASDLRWYVWVPSLAILVPPPCLP